jgi:hypothetical protein
VDLRPIWGLSLYLQCEVERVNSYPALPGMPEEETLAEEIAHREPGTLLVVRGDQTAHVQAFLAKLGYAGRELGAVRSWKLMVLARNPVLTRQGGPSTLGSSYERK